MVFLYLYLCFFFGLVLFVLILFVMFWGEAQPMDQDNIETQVDETRLGSMDSVFFDGMDMDMAVADARDGHIVYSDDEEEESEDYEQDEAEDEVDDVRRR